MLFQNVEKKDLHRNHLSLKGILKIHFPIELNVKFKTDWTCNDKKILKDYIW